MSDVIELVQSSHKVIDKVNVGWGSVIGLLSLLFGEHWILFAGFMALNIVDWLTGWYKSHFFEKESSIEGAKGVVKKVWYWVVIAIAFFISQSFVEMGDVIGLRLNFVVLFGWLTLAMYIVNEIRSILENLVEIGIEVPDFLIKGLDVTSKMMDTKGNQEDE